MPQGNLVYNTSSKNTSGTIPLLDLQRGMYIVKIIASQQVLRVNFMKI
jgi:hypothetical protein